jgi:hypothetical protein
MIKITISTQAVSILLSASLSIPAESAGYLESLHEKLEAAYDMMAMYAAGSEIPLEVTDEEIVAIKHLLAKITMTISEVLNCGIISGQ